MTGQEAVTYIEDYTWSTTRLGLERTRTLLRELGDPQKKLKFIHVAGSNGKGSTCAMLESILRQAGYRTGLYISPYIRSFYERIQVNGEDIPGDDLGAITDRVRIIADRMEDHPSQFELVTAIAMVYFLQRKCDIVILEVGMGGALDSTNVIEAPEVAVITNIGLEHTEYLGDTLEAIARTKAGIIKPGCAVVCYDGAPEVTEVVRTACREKNVPLRCAGFSQIMPLEHSLEGQRFLWRGQVLTLSLLGAHQLRNAAVVLETVLALLRRGWSIGNDAVRIGLELVQWPARFQVLEREPLFILDGGHNPQCAQALAAILEDYLPGEKVTFLMGVLADKDYGAMLDTLIPYAGGFVCLTPDSPRALPAARLAESIAGRCGLPVTVCDTVEDGIRTSLSQGRPVVAFGSLYMAGGVLTAFPGVYRKWLRREKIRARDSLSAAQRESLSEQLVANLIDTPEFQNAKTVLIYRATRGEVRLEALEKAPEAKEKRLAFPLCISNSEMIALLPHGEDSWVEGYCGIYEPLQEKSDLIPPEELDLVVCPGTAFDGQCNRMGMGGGFYDRYLEKCVNAKIALVAFECQKVAQVPVDSWDKPMDLILTETNTYRKNSADKK